MGCLQLIQSDWCDIPTSLTHSLTDTHRPVHNIRDAPTKRYFFRKKKTQKTEVLSYHLKLKIANISCEQMVTIRQP